MTSQLGMGCVIIVRRIARMRDWIIVSTALPVSSCGKNAAGR